MIKAKMVSDIKLMALHRLGYIEIFKLLFLFFIGLTVIIYFAKLDWVETHYESYEKLVQSGDLSKGWISIEIPESATNIVEHHNIDTNEVWVSFEHLSIDSLLDTCRETKVSDTRNLPNRYPSKRWKSNLLKDLDQKKPYKCENGGYIWIRNTNNNYLSMSYNKQVNL